MTKKEKWLLEAGGYSTNRTTAIKTKSKIFSGMSPYQKIAIYDTHWGKMLVLDGVIQLTEYDEHVYHEMLVHVPMATHPAPRNILIIGGGDGGVLREVLKHPIDKVTMIELDKEVTAVCRKYLRIDDGAFGNPLLRLHYMDGCKFVQNTDEKFDVVIADVTDFEGVAKGIFSEKFNRDIYRILTDDGVYVKQAGAPLYYEKELRCIFDATKIVFPLTKLYITDVFSYGGSWPLIIASKKHDPEKPRRLSISNLRTYNPQYHIGAFSLPNFVRECLEQ